MKRATLALALAALIVQHGSERVEAVPAQAMRSSSSRAISSPATTWSAAWRLPALEPAKSSSRTSCNAAIAAAYLYWQVVVPNNGNPDAGGTGVTFKGYPLSVPAGPFGKALGAGAPTCSSAGGGAGSSNGSKKTYSSPRRRAPGSSTSRRSRTRLSESRPLAPASSSPTAPIRSRCRSATASPPLGASLVHHLVATRRLPLSSIVLYDGTYAMDPDHRADAAADRGLLRCGWCSCRFPESPISWAAARPTSPRSCAFPARSGCRTLSRTRSRSRTPSRRWEGTCGTTRPTRSRPMRRVPVWRRRLITRASTASLL